MTRVVRIAALFCVAGILVVSAALASVPDPSTSSYHTEDPLKPDFMDLSGSLTQSTTPDICEFPATTPPTHCNPYTFIIRDFSGAPVVGATVVLDFSNCTDLQISCTQTFLAPYTSTNIGGKKVQATTDAAGVVKFWPAGAATDVLTGSAVDPSPVSTLAGTPCATAYANGVPMRTLKVAAYDNNSLGTPTGAVNGTDVAQAASAAAKATAGRPAYARMDVNHSGTVSGADVSIYSAMAAEQNAGATGVKVTGPYCP